MSEILNLYDEDHKEYSYPNEILVLCTYPELGECLNVTEDVRRRARSYLDNCEGKSVGSYGEMTGMLQIREDVGNYITERDGIPMENYGDIFIEGRQEDLLNLFLPVFPGHNNGGTHGMLVPAPFSPSLQKVINYCGYQTLPYYPLEQGNRWTITEEILLEALDRSTCEIQCLFLENPGYPTGHIYNRSELEIFIKFAKQHGLVIIAIENLQIDVYGDEGKSEFLSTRKVLLESGAGFSKVQLISMFSPNRSALGQPGYSVSFLDSIGMDNLLLKVGNTIFYSAPILYQIYLSLFLGPAKIRNDFSFKQYDLERKQLKQFLSQNSVIATTFLNNLNYVSCSQIKAGQTAFPRLDFPENWLKDNDTIHLERLYCEKLKEETGVRVIPGSEFGQRPGTAHFKLNIPFEEDKLLENLEKIKDFHNRFIKSME